MHLLTMSFDRADEVRGDDQGDLGDNGDHHIRDNNTVMIIMILTCLIGMTPLRQ